jgi:hypothetical protein
MEVLVGVGRVNEGDEGEGNITDEFHIHIWYRTMKPTAIALSEVRG